MRSAKISLPAGRRTDSSLCDLFASFAARGAQSCNFVSPCAIISRSLNVTRVQSIIALIGQMMIHEDCSAWQVSRVEKESSIVVSQSVSHNLSGKSDQ